MYKEEFTLTKYEDIDDIDYLDMTEEEKTEELLENVIIHTGDRSLTSLSQDAILILMNQAEKKLKFSGHEILARFIFEDFCKEVSEEYSHYFQYYDEVTFKKFIEIALYRKHRLFDAIEIEYLDFDLDTSKLKKALSSVEIISDFEEFKKEHFKEIKRFSCQNLDTYFFENCISVDRYNPKTIVFKNCGIKKCNFQKIPTHFLKFLDCTFEDCIFDKDLFGDEDFFKNCDFLRCSFFSY